MLLLFLSICLVNGFIADPDKSIVDNAAANPDLSSLVSVLQSKGYEDVLAALSSSTGTITLFAPNNDACKRTKLNFSKHVDKGIATLYYHALGSVLNSSALTYLQFIESLSQSSDFVNVGDGKGQVLFTEARGDQVKIYFSNTSAKVVGDQINCSNGIIKIVDQVITLPPVAENEFQWAGLGMTHQAIILAGLEDAVNNTAGITIFAPTDKAWKESAYPDPSKVDKDVLANILKYHVVPSIKYTTGLENKDNITTLQGDDVTIQHQAGTVNYMVNWANLVVPNVLLANGVAHFIDKVLVPNTTVIEDILTIEDTIIEV